MYTSELFDIIKSHLSDIQCYMDDTHCYNISKNVQILELVIQLKNNLLWLSFQYVQEFKGSDNESSVVMETMSKQYESIKTCQLVLTDSNTPQSLSY